MNDEEVFECLFSFTDEQAEFSEIVSDFEYEDYFPSTTTNLSTDTKTTELRSSTSSHNSSNSTIQNSLDFDVNNMYVEILNDVVQIQI